MPQMRNDVDIRQFTVDRRDILQLTQAATELVDVGNAALRDCADDGTQLLDVGAGTSLAGCTDDDLLPFQLLLRHVADIGDDLLLRQLFLQIVLERLRHVDLRDEDQHALAWSAQQQIVALECRQDHLMEPLL